MEKYLNRKVLFIIPIIFLFALLFRIFYSYIDTQEQMNEFAYKEAQSLQSLAIAHRNYYQELYVNKTIPLNKNTLKGLPAYSSYFINQKFSQNNPFKISLQTVSDRARNPKNKADAQELQAINYLKEHPTQKEYFSSDNPNYYQYASALTIENRCLKCHAQREDAPKFIRQKYKNAYNYKLGQLRGIVSIKIPKENLNNYFIQHFIYSALYDTLAFIMLFTIIYFIAKKSKQINSYLQQAVIEQTKKLKETLVKERLTGLANRLQLLEDIDSAKDKNNKHLALINIDNFKDINDFYGHDIGDALLIELGRKIDTSCSDTHTTVYKLPSDEFAVFTCQDITADDFKQRISQLLHTINKTQYTISDYAIFLTVSCGIASDENDLIIKADMALQVAKSSKANFVVYDNVVDTTENVNKNIRGIALLKDAIENDKITPYFQAIYNLHTQKIEKYESLVRIITDTGDIITPYQFLNIATKSKLYHHITYTMIEKTFAFFEDKEAFEFSINLSIDDILNERTVAFILKKLSDYPAPQRVVFEILEDNEIKNYEEIRIFIQKVKHYNVKIAIDDFGSGYSNFSHVLELNVDYLKIDASLVKNITHNENAKKITQTIVSFAKNIGLKTIAEYVEDEASLKILESFDVDFVQGYYIGKPAPTLL
ncbi:EAL domain-containing protein [Sulfurimonas paralvinellae]|uniref:EAL domain-containing protein n=1 Tax=Sulfurimonas paralvinellae TaxID=317658 RepID=A0A7M1B5T5_9BACT|nr:EAL domain-containing protein [Sulfurimonas paralvinellae]QOP45030.1 EAL domain-containing protein [Sulfurimonas paralvinellae]